MTLARAREKAAECRTALNDDIDPIERRRALRVNAALTSARAMTFRQAASAYIAAHEAGWRGRNSHEQWTSSLANHVYPVIGDLPVAAINVGLVLKVLEPIWNDKTETASRLRGRIESILDWARARGFRAGENPARWKGHLASLLPAKSKVKRVQHHRALPYVEIGDLVKELRAQHTIAAAALEFLVVTAVRAGEGLNATWDEIDMKTRTWVIPGSRTKNNKEHRVPLSDQAIAVLRKMEAIRSGPYIFQGGKSDRARSQQSLRKLLHRLGRSDATVIHGLRSSFRSWAAERTNFPREVAEAGVGPHGRQPGRARLCTDRPVRRAPPADDRVGAILRRGAGRDRRRGRADKAPKMKNQRGGVRDGSGRPRLFSSWQEIEIGIECHEEIRKIMEFRLIARIEKSVPDTVEEEQKRARAAIEAKRLGNKAGPGDLSADEVLDEVHKEIDTAMTPGATPGAFVRARSAVAYRNARGVRAKIFGEAAARWSAKLDKNVSVRTIRRAHDKYRSKIIRAAEYD